MVQAKAEKPKNALHDLGYKIFLDRYAQKDMTRSTLEVGDTVIVVVNPATGQREVGKITAMDLPQVTIELLDGETVTRDIENVDKPLETDPAQMMARVARGIAEAEATPELQAEWAKRFEWLLDDFKFVPAGRILAAAGTSQALTFYNCYVIPSPRDSRGGIIETLRQMTEIMSRGGGVGINISSLRPRHSYVKGVNGRSSGSVSWGALYSFVTGLIEQGGSRRGALMLILNDWHPDVFDFINSKREAGKITNANISVGLSDKFMDAVKADGDWDLVFPDSHHPDYDELWDGDLEKWVEAGRPVMHYRTVKAREIWDALIESAWASAEPGVWFRERANKMSNSWYYDSGKLIATNPCVTGDTRIYTNRGLVKARELFDDETDIEAAIDGRFGLTNATTPSTRVFMTGVKPVYRLTTREGYTVRATADHRFMTPQGWVELQNLRDGDKIHVLNRKGGFGQTGSLELGRVLGWIVGDGKIKKESVVLSFLGDEKRELAPMFSAYVSDLVEPLTTRNRVYGVGITKVADRDEARVMSTRLRTIAIEHGLTEQKHRVPETVFQGTEEMQRGFLQALFTADGSIQQTNRKAVIIRLASSYLDLLIEVQQLLSNFGIASRIFKNRRPAQMRKMPDSKGGYKEYPIKAQHELHISKSNTVRFMEEISFLTERKNSTFAERIKAYRNGPRPEAFVVTVESITYDGEEEVFDITEPITHSMVINGLVSHQCGEQSLAGWSVCNLGAINLAKFYDEDAHDVKWDDLDRAVRYATRFLDNVIDSTQYFFAENERQQRSERRVGLNNMGLAELMIRLGIRYGSEESVQFIDKLYSFIARASYETSAELAREKGAFPEFNAEKFLQSGFMKTMPEDVREKVRRDGIRNVTLLTQAPTGTTGTMVNTSTGIEPFFSWVYYRKSRLGLHEEQVPLVKEWYEAHPDADKLPDYFVTAMDLTPEEHVRVQAAIQRWVDSSISKTANLPNSYTVEETRKLYEYMYELGCKGGTVYRDGSRDEQVLILKKDEDKKQDKTGDTPVAQVTQVVTPHYVYPRPSKLHGVTVSCKTPYGTAYVTMNSDEHGYPFELFITAPGKAGSDLQADAEGLGRMISLQLRTTAPQNRLQMLKLIIDQLQGIGGSRSVGMGPNRVTSLPDAVAGALYAHFFPQDRVQQMSLFMPQMDVPMLSDMMPEMNVHEHHHSENGHGETYSNGSTGGYIRGAEICPSCGTVSLLRVEGCKKCGTCGYSEC